MTTWNVQPDFRSLYDDTKYDILKWARLTLIYILVLLIIIDVIMISLWRWWFKSWKLRCGHG